jgi:SAM-dependent methyltransferase
LFVESKKYDQTKGEPVEGTEYFDLTLEDFARSFGTTVKDIPDECRELIAKTDFRYKILEGEERDKVLLAVLKKIEADQQIVGTEERQTTWEKGWEENLQDFINSGHDLNKLVPKFIRPNQAIRLNRNYIMPLNPNFELDYFSVFRLWLFTKYLKDFDSIYEFGCGTGFNLVVLAQLYPEKKLHGLDFVPSSVELVNKIGEVYGWKMTGHLFDMVSPDENLEIEDNSAIFTIATIEQLASNFEAFLQFLLKRSPKLCIHVEPTIELYDESNLIDYLAIKFHRKRGYTDNYLTRLRELEAQNIIEILKVKRLFFGSLYHEGYPLILWRPKTRAKSGN